MKETPLKLNKPFQTTPLRMALLLALGALAVGGEKLAWATTFQSMTDGVQTFSNDKTFTGNITIGMDAGVAGNFFVTGTTTSTGTTYANGQKDIGLLLDAGYAFIVAPDGGVSHLVELFNGEVTFDSFGDFATIGDAGVLGASTLGSGTAGTILAQIGSGTAETNAILPVTYMDRAAPAQHFALECGADAGTSNALSVALHFQNVGTTLPLCFCADVNAAGKACNVSAAPTATGAAFIDTGSSSDVVEYCCIGPK